MTIQKEISNELLPVCIWEGGRGNETRNDARNKREGRKEKSGRMAILHRGEWGKGNLEMYGCKYIKR